jgi:hypothetical protein
MVSAGVPVSRGRLAAAQPGGEACGAGEQGDGFAEDEFFCPGLGPRAQVARSGRLAAA